MEFPQRTFNFHFGSLLRWIFCCCCRTCRNCTGLYVGMWESLFSRNLFDHFRWNITEILARSASPSSWDRDSLSFSLFDL